MESLSANNLIRQSMLELLLFAALTDSTPDCRARSGQAVGDIKVRTMVAAAVRVH
jgi:hypothetical protein